MTKTITLIKQVLLKADLSWYWVVAKYNILTLTSWYPQNDYLYVFHQKKSPVSHTNNTIVKNCFRIWAQILHHIGGQRIPLLSPLDSNPLFTPSLIVKTFAVWKSCGLSDWSHTGLEHKVGRCDFKHGHCTEESFYHTLIFVCFCLNSHWAEDGDVGATL